MGADPAAFRVAQFMLQRFGKGLHARLRDIVGGIAGRGGDALLRAGVDDQAGASAFDHARREHLRAVDDPPEIDAENALPVLQGAEHLAARLNAGIVHQDVRAAEPFSNAGFQRRHILDPADIDGAGHDIGAAARRGGCSSVSASASRSPPRSAIHTFMPSRANRIAAARPIPDAPPVTTATWLGDRAGWVTAFFPIKCSYPAR